MGIKDFSKQMFSKTIKDSFSYICAIALTAMLVFVTVNIASNEVIYGENTTQLIKVYRQVGLGRVLVDTSLGYIQREFILITILIVGVFTVVSNNTFLKKRVDELAFVVMNGATISEMSYYIRYMCSKMFIVASLLGAVLGIVFAPVFNLLMYKIVGVEGQIFIYDGESFLLVLGYMIVNYLYLMISSTSYVYRKEVVELMDENREKNCKDTRMIKFPSIIYLLLYICPGFLLLLPDWYGDINGFITVGVYISIVATIGVIIMYIPKKLRSLNNKEFMNHKEKRIYINNAFIKLKNTIIYIAGMVVAINYFLSKILDFRKYNDIVVILLFCMIVCVVVITVTLTNKIIDDCGINEVFYKDLSAIGYSKKELFKIGVKENKTIISAILFFIEVPIIFAVLMNIKNGSIATEMLILIGTSTTIPILIGALGSYKVNKENLYKILEIESNESLMVTEIIKLLEKTLMKLLLGIFKLSEKLNIVKKNSEIF